VCPAAVVASTDPWGFPRSFVAASERRVASIVNLPARVPISMTSRRSRLIVFVLLCVLVVAYLPIGAFGEESGSAPCGYVNSISGDSTAPATLSLQPPATCVATLPIGVLHRVPADPAESFSILRI